MRAIDDDRDASLPPDLMATLYRRYETAKARAGRIDFEDMLELTIGLIEADDAIAAEVRDRYRWFSVDEYQDTNPLQAALLDAWLGGRQDLAVVGDEDQTIYTFTGATQRLPDRLRGALPGRPGREARDQLPLHARGAGVREQRPRGGPDPRPTSDSPASRRGRRNACVASNDLGTAARDRWICDRRGRAGRDHRRDPGARAGRDRARRDGDPGPNERAAARDRGRARRGRDPVPRPRRAILRPTGGPPCHASGRPLAARRERRRAGHRDSRPPSSANSASAATPCPMARPRRNVTARSSRSWSLPRTWPGPTPRRMWPAFLAEVERRTEVEAGGTRPASSSSPTTAPRVSSGMRSSSRHSRRARCRSANRPTPDELAEERRLLYVGITRARRYLWLSWATTRTAASGRGGRRNRSRFLDGLVPASARRVAAAGDRGAERPATDRQGRSGRPVAALECAPCLAHGPCPSRRRRPIHRLPRLDDRGHRSTPARGRWRSCAASRASGR